MTDARGWDLLSTPGRFARSRRIAGRAASGRIDGHLTAYRHTFRHVGRPRVISIGPGYSFGRIYSSGNVSEPVVAKEQAPLDPQASCV